MNFLSELKIASTLVYTKHGSSTKAAKSRQVRDRLKRGDPALLASAAKRLSGWLSGGDVLAEFLARMSYWCPFLGAESRPCRHRVVAGTARRTDVGEGGRPSSREIAESLDRRIQPVAGPLWVGLFSGFALAHHARYPLPIR